jgi:hypothetical protein
MTEPEMENIVREGNDIQSVINILDAEENTG